METGTFYIRSLFVQNLIMAAVVVLIIGLLVHAVILRKREYAIAVVIWALLTAWFFNGPLWGYSSVTVSQQGLRLDYGFMSVLKNTTLAPDTPWKISIYMSGIRRTKRLYFLTLASNRSMKVRGSKRLEVLQAIGAAIDSLNGRPMGEMETRAVNM